MVGWGRARSDMFRIWNGTRQGSIASPVICSVYCDMLLKELRHLVLGDQVAGMYMGVAAYADDLVLLAPNREATEQMIAICESWALENNVYFSTDPDPKKAKCTCVGRTQG